MALPLNNLAELYNYLDENEKAETLFQMSLEIYEKCLGPDHPDTANALSALGQLYENMGDYSKAETYFQSSLNINEKKLGLDHPSTAKSLNALAFLAWRRAEYNLADRLAQKETISKRNNLGKVLLFASERQRLSYQRGVKPYSLLGTFGNASILSDVVLQNKGIVLDSLLEDKNVVDESLNSTSKKTIQEMRVYGQRLVELQIANGASDKNVVRRNDEREILEQKVENLQKTLAEKVSSFGRTRRAFNIATADVQGVISHNTILVEFVRYTHYLEKRDFEQRIGALLIGDSSAKLNTGRVGYPVWIQLGSAKSIKTNLNQYAVAMRSGRKGDEAILKALYAQLFEPIQKQLPEGTKTLIISPDAELNFLNFATLIDGNNKFVAEKYDIKYVTSGRDLVFGPKSKSQSKDLVVFANPSFSEKPLCPGIRDTNIVQLAVNASDRRDYGGLTLGPLPGTEQEMLFLKTNAFRWNMKEKDFHGREATEAEINALQSPYILHLATHGFLLPDIKNEDDSKSMKMIGDDPRPVVLNNPMQRSGLALAGANITLEAWKRGEVPPTENDGILMAQEVGLLNLKGTWLVVLSACDTGMGEVRAGEGVLGLRRGFVQAGAQNLLMTLWPVSDKWTAEIMKDFYDKALQTGDAPQALADIQRNWLVRLKKDYGPLLAARIAGPFVMTFQGKPGNQ